MQENNFKTTATRETSPENQSFFTEASQPPAPLTAQTQLTTKKKKIVLLVYFSSILTAIISAAISNGAGLIYAMIVRASDGAFSPSEEITMIYTDIVSTLTGITGLIITFIFGAYCFKSIKGVAKFAGIKIFSSLISNAVSQLVGFIAMLLLAKVFSFEADNANTTASYIGAVVAFIADIIILIKLTKKLEESENNPLACENVTSAPAPAKLSAEKMLIAASIIIYAVTQLVNTVAGNVATANINMEDSSSRIYLYITNYPSNFIVNCVTFAAVYGLGYYCFKNLKDSVNFMGIRAVGFSAATILTDMLSIIAVVVIAMIDNDLYNTYQSTILYVISAVNLVLGTILSVLFMRYINKKETSAATLNTMQ